MTAIQTHGLTKTYGVRSSGARPGSSDERRESDGGVVALEDLDLTVERGEVFGFLGPNGAGKTTTIDLLLDFIRPTSGSAEVLGYDAHAEPGEVRDRIGILPDGFDLWDRSTGYRHLEFAIESKGGSETPDELLERVGLDPEDAERKVGDYSKGMQQRLAMGMALAGEPDLLILDEPSSGLDPHGIREMQSLVREEAERGTTVFFSSHILGQVSAVCDRVGILDEGELVTVDTIEGLRERAGIGAQLFVEVDRVPDVDLSAIDCVTAVRTDGGEIELSIAEDRAKGLAIHRLVEVGAEVRDFHSEEATLEDLFAAYTGTSAESVTTADAGAGDGRSGTEAPDGGPDAGVDPEPAVAANGGDDR